jgi:hypothetical protein
MIRKFSRNDQEDDDGEERGVREAVGIWRGAISGNMKISF